MSNDEYPISKLLNSTSKKDILISQFRLSLSWSRCPAKAANHLAGQLLRSGTSLALNYAKAQSGESRNDFIHKIKIVLKELRETGVCLKIIYKAKLFKSEDELNALLKETGELVAIFAKGAKTAESSRK